MKIRGANNRDVVTISKLYDEYGFKLEPNHLEMILIAEDDNNKIIAIASLNTVLECAFLTVKDAGRKNKIEALKKLIQISKQSVRDLKYDLVHAFANELIAPILKKHFEFQPAKGENLVLFVE